MPPVDAKQAATGALALTVGIALGAGLTPDAQPELADVAAQADTPSRTKQLDTAAYHRAVTAVKQGRSDLTDLLTPDVAPGAEVTTSVNLDLGTRPQAVEYAGEARGKFETLSLTHVDRDDATEIILRARNTSTETLRLWAFVQFSPPRTK